MRLWLGAHTQKRPQQHRSAHAYRDLHEGWELSGCSRARTQVQSASEYGKQYARQKPIKRILTGAHSDQQINIIAGLIQPTREGPHSFTYPVQGEHNLHEHVNQRLQAERSARLQAAECDRGRRRVRPATTAPLAWRPRAPRAATGSAGRGRGCTHHWETCHRPPEA